MARVKEQEEWKEISEWKKEKKVSDSVHAGLCALKNWTIGKEVTEKEYDDARKEFLTGGK